MEVLDSEAPQSPDSRPVVRDGFRVLHDLTKLETDEGPYSVDGITQETLDMYGPNVVDVVDYQLVNAVSITDKRLISLREGATPRNRIQRIAAKIAQLLS